MVTFLLDNKVIIIFTAVLALLFFVDQRARESEKGKVEVDNLKGLVETRKEVEDAIKDVPSTADLVLEWLSQRQQSK